MKIPLINFVHIPKTAGTTFISILKENFSPHDFFQINGMNPDESMDKIAAMPAERRDAIKLLMGHWSIEFEQFFPDREIHRIVYVREPVRHFLSTYYYIRKTKVHAQYDIANRLSLSEFVEYRQATNLDNLQTRHLAGIPTNMSAGTIQFARQGRTFIAKAKEELEKSRYVFLTDKFDESLAILKLQAVPRKIK